MLTVGDQTRQHPAWAPPITVKKSKYQPSFLRLGQLDTSVATVFASSVASGLVASYTEHDSFDTFSPSMSMECMQAAADGKGVACASEQRTPRKRCGLLRPRNRYTLGSVESFFNTMSMIARVEERHYTIGNSKRGMMVVPRSNLAY